MFSNKKCVDKYFQRNEMNLESNENCLEQIKLLLTFTNKYHNKNCLYLELNSNSLEHFEITIRLILMCNFT